MKRAHGRKAVSLRNGLCFLAGDFYIGGQLVKCPAPAPAAAAAAPTAAVSALIDKILSLLLSIIIYTYLTFIIGDDM